MSDRIAFIDEWGNGHVFNDYNDAELWLARNGYLDDCVDKDEMIEYAENVLFPISREELDSLARPQLHIKTDDGV